MCMCVCGRWGGVGLTGEEQKLRLTLALGRVPTCWWGGGLRSINQLSAAPLTGPKNACTPVLHFTVFLQVEKLPVQFRLTPSAD